jgi:hypothetical protein
MTEINGLRLAYRGFVTGLAGGYVWVAIGMAFSALATGDPLFALRPFALAVTPLATSPELAFVLGFALVQIAGAVVGMLFAYFFARFFTVRTTLTVAAPVVALLAWGLVAAAFTRDADGITIARHAAPVLATLGYGILLAAGIPVRGDVTRYSGSAGSPST